MNGKERTRSGTKPGKGILLITIYDSFLEFLLLFRQYVNFPEKKTCFIYITNVLVKAPEEAEKLLFLLVVIHNDGLGFLK